MRRDRLALQVVGIAWIALVAGCPSYEIQNSSGGGSGGSCKAFDDCKTPADDDCDGKAIAACTGDPQAKASAWSGTQKIDDAIFAIAGGPTGEFALGGIIDGHLDVGAAPQDGKIFLVMRAANGDLADWSGKFSYAESSNAWVEGAAIDAGGNVYIAGTFTGQVSIEGAEALASNNGSQDGFVAAFDKDGNPLWSHAIGDGAVQAVHGVAVDGEGHVLVVGEFEGALDPEGNIKSTGNVDGFLVALDAEGKLLSTRIFGGAGTERARAVAVGPDGRAVIAGNYENGLSFADVNTTADAKGMFITATGDLGESMAFTNLYPADSATVRTVAVAPDGGIAFGGDYYNKLEIAGDKHDYGGNSALSPGAFVVTLDADGKARWVKWAQGGAARRVMSLAFDPATDLVVAGLYTRRIDFGSGPSASNGNDLDADVYAAKLRGTDGEPLWLRSFGDYTVQGAYAVATDAAGWIYLGGGFMGTLKGTSVPGASSGAQDAFLLQLAP
jgi:hypothetical protein